MQTQQRTGPTFHIWLRQTVSGSDKPSLRPTEQGGMQTQQRRCLTSRSGVHEQNCAETFERSSGRRRDVRPRHTVAQRCRFISKLHVDQWTTRVGGSLKMQDCGPTAEK